MRFRFAVCLTLFVRAATVAAQEHPGEAAFAKVCRVCHGPQGRGDLAPALVPMTMETDWVLAIVREGFGQMPPISSRELTDDEVAQIVEYLKSLGSRVRASPASLSAAGSDPNDEKEVMATLAIVANATVNRDLATLEKIYHRELTYGDSSGSTQTKAERLKAVGTGSGIESTPFSDATIRIYGSVALIRCIAHLPEGSARKTHELDVDVLWVLVKGPQGWQIVARHATRIAP